MSDGIPGSWLSARGRYGGSFRFRYLRAALITILSIAALGQSQPEPVAGDASLGDILAYIRSGWDSLTRSTSSCGAASDPKLSAALVIYLPADFEPPRELDQMQRVCNVRLARL